LKYEVTEVTQGDDWDNNYGKYRTFLVRFQGQDQQIQINRKFKGDDVKAPAVADELEGSIELQANGVPKFKQDYGSAGGSGGGSTQPKKDGLSKEYWSSKDKRISRQWAMGRALELLIANRKEEQLITVEQVAKAAGEFEKHLPDLKDE